MPGAAHTPVAERRVCSVLFCDLVGFTPLSESRDPEAVRELLSEYFRLARMVVSRYGGVVEKFIGDAVMAVWGTPVATEGDAERAVRAGLDLVAAVGQLGLEAGAEGLAARAGVVTGEVAVTLGAANEGMVAGDAVNTAARVQAAAAAGAVLADSATRRLAGGAIGFADTGEHTLKGKSGPVALWRATRVLAGVGGAQRIDGLEAPLTGRDAELRTIKELFHAAADRKVPRMVLVSGPAGVGKSRLGWEFEKYADGLAAEMWWHRGRCLSYGEGVSFWALAEIVRQRLGIAEDDPAETAEVRLAVGLDRLVPDPGERAYVGVRLGRLLGILADGDGGGPLPREELFAGWRLFFERLAASRPVVLLVEDAQHADAGLLDFLDHMTDWVRDLPMFVLVFARPELAQARPGFGTGRNRTALTLDPLDPASMDGLIEALVPGMPPTARTAITGRAQGLPLFTVEIIRALIDRDVVQPSEGVYRLVGEIGELTVPDSLHALLAARLDALDLAVRRLAADAAVLGTTFPADALIAVSDQDENDVRAGLRELLRREILSVSADRLSPERGSYRFTQDMVRQVAYDTLSRRDRKTRHLKVAAHLRAAFPGDGEEVADVIARHYLDAAGALPDDPDTRHIRSQAVTALIRAAERAERTGAPARAAAAYATAAQHTHSAGADEESGEGQQAADPPPDPGELWERAADAALTHGDYPDAIDHAGRARDHYLQHDQHRAAARAQALTGTALQQQGRHGEARQQFTAALQVLQVDPDIDTVRALQQFATLEVFAGSPDAGRLTTEPLILGQALGADTARLVGLLTIRGIYLCVAARNVEGIAYLTQAARLAEQAGDNTQMGRVLMNLSEALAVRDPTAAAAAARTAAGHLRQAGDRPLLAGATENLVQALLLLGDWDAADDVLTQAIDSDGLGDIEYLACERGLLAALRGDSDTAAAVLAGLKTMRASEDLQDQSVIAVVEAFTADARREPRSALAHARRTLAHADALGMSFESLRWAWPLAARSAHDLGDSVAVGELLAMLDAYPPGHLPPMLLAERDLTRARAAARGGAAAADISFVDALAVLRAQSTPFHLGHGLLDHAEHLLRRHDASAAARAVAEACDIAGRLRCQPLLGRADGIAVTAAGDQERCRDDQRR
jgi:class 3 adenylate cyclase/tetratricopeptide (TPR) repeat protein